MRSEPGPSDATMTNRPSTETAMAGGESADNRGHPSSLAKDAPAHAPRMALAAMAFGLFLTAMGLTLVYLREAVPAGILLVLGLGTIVFAAAIYRTVRRTAQGT